MLRLLLLTLTVALLFTQQASAELPTPKGNILLTVIGQIRHTNQFERAEFDQQMLESLEQHEVTTQNPWFPEANTYRGPLGRALIHAVGAEQATTMRMVSINGFIADIPVSDFMDYDTILALEKNGKALRIRDRGPLFTIYPFDQHPQLKTEMHYNRSVWQVKTIEFQ